MSWTTTKNEPNEPQFPLSCHFIGCSREEMDNPVLSTVRPEQKSSTSNFRLQCYQTRNSWKCGSLLNCQGSVIKYQHTSVTYIVGYLALLISREGLFFFPFPAISMQYMFAISALSHCTVDTYTQASDMLYLCDYQINIGDRDVQVNCRA